MYCGNSRFVAHGLITGWGASMEWGGAAKGAAQILYYFDIVNLNERRADVPDGSLTTTLVHALATV